MRFEWDVEKAEANQRKHGISFVTAARVFDDPFVITIQDRVEGFEYRWQSFGTVAGYPLMMVAHVDRDEDGEEIIRIISARLATPRERRRYGQDR